MGSDGTAPQPAIDGTLTSHSYSTMALLFLSSIIAAAAAAPPTPVLIDPQVHTEACQFGVGSRQYDICSIFGGAAEFWPLVVHSADAEYHWNLDLAGDSGSSSDLGRHCPPGTRICLIQNSEGIPISDASSVITFHPETDESITLRFAEGPQAARVRLICDAHTELGQPVFSGVAEGHTHLFTWRTKHGCPSVSLPSVPAFKVLDSESESPSDDTPDSSQPDDESDLVDGNRQRHSRRYTAIIFFVVSIIVISLFIISYKYPHRLNALFREHIVPLFQCVSGSLHRINVPILHPLKPAGEGRLVRWAQEDLELEVDADDTDVMVNGGDAYEEDTGDEYIPLSPSPRKGGRVKNYGSASPYWVRKDDYLVYVWNTINRTVYVYNVEWRPAG
ncbi:hypothetical protein GGX14DRAFT_544567 [Mycena pura]|uniref:MRH domain-containing protein n=1 Tax=Mycena pura TaxID=153505 RepID=A0AAD6Y585_9AGAR|nr:hypothetical protein GGX14DRAFT_544567 [Mycena pura]